MFDQARKYAWYYLNAKTKHGVHSPFVFDFVTKVLDDKTVYPEYERVEKVRMGLLNNRLVTEVHDFGAGATKAGVYEKRVSEITAKSAKPAKWGKLLYRICSYYGVKDMLELGTSLGLSASYQAFGALKANSEINFVSIEGSPALAELAQINFTNLNIQNHVKVETGNFDLVLDNVLSEFEKLDYVFIDGNHRKEPTLRYFEQVLTKSHNETILIFDDINWSEEMCEAWEIIKKHPEVTVSLDLFYMGIVFLRKEQVEEHFMLRF